MKTKNKNIGLDIVAGLTQEQARQLLTCIHGEDADFFRELTRKVYPKMFEEARLAAGAAPSWAEFLLRHRISGACIFGMVDGEGQIVGGDDASDLQVINPAGWDCTSLKRARANDDSGKDRIPDTGLAPVEIFTDGACSGNPGPGGWAAVCRSSGCEWELSGGEPLTTNNRMELMAPISALEALQPGRTVTITTDSKYVKDGITKWVAGWKRNGWKTAARKDVKNRDLWERLVAAAEKHQVSWEWVRGHDGHPENERADVLARQVISVNAEDWSRYQPY